MAQERDIMSTFKKLSRINKEGGAMSSEERSWFEDKKEKSAKLETLIKVNTQNTHMNRKDL